MRLTEIDRLFSDFFGSNNSMKVDIYELEQTYLLEAELPGISKENIHIEYKNDTLTILADQDEELKKATIIRKERSKKQFMRSFHIPHINFKESKAQFKNGILTINLLKADLIDNGQLITIE